MECKCGYKGLAEIGIFSGKKGNTFREEIHYRCPKCKTTDFNWINSIDSIREALIFPRGRNVYFIKGGADPNSVGYTITDAKGWGCGSAISLKEFNALKIEFPYLNFDRVTKDCDTELRKLGIDPERLSKF